MFKHFYKLYWVGDLLLLSGEEISRIDIASRI